MIVFIKQYEGDFVDAKVFNSLKEATDAFNDLSFTKMDSTIPSWFATDEEENNYILIQTC